jgi:hypothetical protein
MSYSIKMGRWLLLSVSVTNGSGTYRPALRIHRRAGAAEKVVQAAEAHFTLTTWSERAWARLGPRPLNGRSIYKGSRSQALVDAGCGAGRRR